METNNPLLIAIDPGHGGRESGAQWNGRNEKDDNLRLGLAVRDALARQGVEALMTRDSDVSVSLPDRVRAANQSDVDLFVSLHRRGGDQQSTGKYGVENFIYLTAPEATSGEAARRVLSAVADVGVQENHGVSRGNYYVLRRTAMPAMLLEMGSILNEEDNRLFDQNLSAYAEAVARGVTGYFGLPWQPPSGIVPPIGELPQPPVINPLPPSQPQPPVINPIPPNRPQPPGVNPLPPNRPQPPVINPTPPNRPRPPGVNPLPPNRPQPPAPPESIPVPPIAPQPPRPPRPPGNSGNPGNRAELISDAQRALNSIFGAGLQVDGVYGPATKTAVIRALQGELNRSRNAGIAVDGEFGPATRALLPSLRQGDTGGIVSILQILLKLHGYDTGGIDGVYGPRTKMAVTMFQRDNFLIPDGVAGPRTLAYLLR